MTLACLIPDSLVRALIVAGGVCLFAQLCVLVWRSEMTRRAERAEADRDEVRAAARRYGAT